MRPIAILLAVVAVACSSGRLCASPVTLTFEGLPGNLVPVPNGYGGLDWKSMYYLNGTTWHVPGTGYTNGIVSPNFVALNPWGQPAEIRKTGGGRFRLVDGYFTNSSSPAFPLDVEGWLDGGIRFEGSYAINPAGPTHVVFNWSPVAMVRFTNHSANFVLDNLTVDVGAVPEIDPAGITSVFTLMAVGFGLLERRFHRTAPRGRPRVDRRSETVPRN